MDRQSVRVAACANCAAVQQSHVKARLGEYPAADVPKVQVLAASVH
jgi:hypothetical protein